MMSGPLPASTAAAVFVCSWSAVIRSTATLTPYLSPNSVHWRTNSVSAAGTKCTHWSSRMEAPWRGVGTVAGVLLVVVPPQPQASSSGPGTRPRPLATIGVHHPEPPHDTTRREERCYGQFGDSSRLLQERRGGGRRRHVRRQRAGAARGLRQPVVVHDDNVGQPDRRPGDL